MNCVLLIICLLIAVDVALDCLIELDHREVLLWSRLLLLWSSLLWNRSYVRFCMPLCFQETLHHGFPRMSVCLPVQIVKYLVDKVLEGLHIEEKGGMIDQLGENLVKVR